MAASTTGRARPSRSGAAALPEPLDRIPAFCHCAQQAPAVGLVARHERELDLRLRHGYVHPLAVVLHGDHIAALLGDEREKLDQLAGTVCKPRADDDVATGDREP